MSQAVEIPEVENARRDGAPADCTPRQLAEERYRQALSGMVDHALEHRQVELLVDKLARTLASVGFHFGPGATADILTRFGRHLSWLAERKRAEEEAERARKEGRVFQ